MNLLARLCALVLAALLPALAVQGYQLLELRRVADERTRDSALRLAQFAAGEVGQIVAGGQALLEVLAQLPAVRALDGPACSALVAAIDEVGPQVAALGAFDREGRMFCGTAGWRPEVGVADRAYFREALDQGRFTVGRFVASRVDGQRYLPLALPFPGPDGRPAGVVYAGISLDWLSERLRQKAMPPGGSISVLDRGGTFLVRWPGLELVGQPMRDRLRWMLDAPESTTLRDVGPDGVERIVGFVPPAALGGAEAGGGLLVTVGFSTREVLAETEATLRRGLLLIGGSALLALLAALAAGQAFVRRPVARLLAAAGRVAAGDYTARAGLSDQRSELGRVGVAFDAMAGTLAEREAERGEVLAALRRSEERLRLILESAVDYAIVTLDLQGRVTGWNPGAERVLGHAEADIVGRSFVVLFTPEDRAGGVPEGELRDALAKGSGGDDRWMLRGDGRRFWAGGTVVPLRDGEVRGFLKILRDETPRREAEQALQRLNETLEQRVAEAVEERRLAEAKAFQSQKMELVGQLTGGIAHDFNNLLTAAGVSLEFLARHTAPEGAPHVENARHALARGAAVVRQLLAFSRREPVRAEVVDANAVLLGMAGLLENSVRAGARLSVEPAPEPCHVEVDPVQLEAAVLNLVLNARDAMGEVGGRVRVVTRALPGAEGGPGRGHVAVEVADDGPGMAPEVAARAFEPFFTTKADGKGTGLGLSMVYGFARQSGGTAEIETRPGRGTTVRLLLPRAAAVPATAPPAAEAGMDGPAGTPPERAGGATVLLVEDDAIVLLANEDGLATAGYRVLAAGDAAEALAVLAAEPAIRVVVSDVVMPGTMNGVALSREIRSRHPGVRVILTSGYGTEQLRRQGAEADAYLPKPFDVAALARRIDAVLARPPGGSAGLLEGAAAAPGRE